METAITSTRESLKNKIYLLNYTKFTIIEKNNSRLSKNIDNKYLIF